MVMCLGQGADLHMAQLMPLPLTISCSSKSRLVLSSWFYFSGNPRRNPVVYVCLFHCSGFFDIYNEEKGNMEQHAISILNVSVKCVYI